MYLEISARQTGKTARMIQEIRNTLNKNLTPILFVHSVLHWNNSLSRFFTNEERTKIRIFTLVEEYNRFLIGRKISQKVRLFYDEFDLFKNPDNVIIDLNGYYQTTPIRLRKIEDIVLFRLGMRKDPLLELLFRNNGQYVSHSALSYFGRMSLESIANLRKTRDINFSVDFGGQIFER